jgi:hypothetical protein
MCLSIYNACQIVRRLTLEFGRCFGIWRDVEIFKEIQLIGFRTSTAAYNSDVICDENHGISSSAHRIADLCRQPCYTTCTWRVPIPKRTSRVRVATTLFGCKWTRDARSASGIRNSPIPIPIGNDHHQDHKQCANIFEDACTPIIF